MIVIINHHDSFTYNLAQYAQQLGEEVIVMPYGTVTLTQICEMSPTMILLSPGPGNPSDYPQSLELIDIVKGDIPILGVCLGYQMIAQFFGASIKKGKQPVHGKVSAITHQGRGIFYNLPSPLNVTRYHSLVADKETLPDCLEITAETLDGTVMALAHRLYHLAGVQFHPEAVLTENGLDMLRNFIQRKRNNHE